MVWHPIFESLNYRIKLESRSQFAYVDNMLKRFRMHDFIKGFLFAIEK